LSRTRRALALAAASLGVVAAAAPALGASGWDWSVAGSSEWAVRSGDGHTSKFQVALAPEFSVDLESMARIVGRARARADARDRLGSSEPAVGESAQLSAPWLSSPRAELELRELYADFDLGRTAVRLGKQQIVWGKADGLRLLDLVNPVDFREFILEDFEESRIPQWSLSLEREFGPLGAEALWIPDNSVDRLPKAGKDFAFTSPVLVPRAPAGLGVVTREVHRPKRTWRDSDFGLRLSAFGQESHATFNYLYRYDDLPALYRELPSSPGDPLVISPKHERQQVIGGTFSTAAGAWVVRSELAVTLGSRQFTVDARDRDGVVRTTDFRGVIGLDWSPRSHTLVSGQLFQSTLGERFAGLGRDRTERTLTLLVRRQFRHDTWTAQALLIQDLNRSDGLVRLHVEHALADDVSIWFGFDWFFGRTDGIFGEFDGNDRFLVGAKVHL
jgi:hypothetical protein